MRWVNSNQCIRSPLNVYTNYNFYTTKKNPIIFLKLSTNIDIYQYIKYHIKKFHILQGIFDALLKLQKLGQIFCISNYKNHTIIQRKFANIIFHTTIYTYILTTQVNLLLDR